jgi:uncharacterized protein (DUF2235 family)
VLIGFSRGAFTAQCVAAILNDRGVLDLGRVTIDDTLTKEEKERGKKGSQKQEEERRKKRERDFE